jgi:uncharacterized protein
MLLPYVELRYVDDTIGYGTFATQFIPKGTITWVRDTLDQTIPQSVVDKMSPLHRTILDKYSFQDALGDWILCWDHARFLNHSCQANCLSPGFEFEIAVRDVQPGEEITDDYGMLYTDPFTCHCRQPACRGTVRQDDLIVHGDVWDDILRAAFPFVGKVPQPLWDLVIEKETVADVLAGRAELPSCRLNIPATAETR